MFFKKKKKSKAGTEIFKYDESTLKNEWTPPAAMKYIEEIEQHFNRCFKDRKTSVFHEIISDTVHIDVHILEPTDDEPYYVLYTTGMSDLAMTPPAEYLPKYQHLERAELMAYLPSDWPVVEMLSSDAPEESYWPVRMLKYLARFPHLYQTWLGHGHTIPNGGNYEPYASNTALSCMLLLTLDRDIYQMEAADKMPIHFYLLHPLYQEEADFKLQNGLNVLVEKLSQLPLNEVNPFIIDIERKNSDNILSIFSS